MIQRQFIVALKSIALAAVLFACNESAAQQPCPAGTTPDYEVTQTTGTITPGTEDIGNHCEDCTSVIGLPFPVTVYDLTFTTVRVSSNGNLQFIGNSAGNDFDNTNLPSAVLNTAICAFWDDLQTDATGDGIFTSVTGTAPDRTFNIEWRVKHFDTGEALNFAVELLEGSSTFHLVYGTPSAGASGTIGTQRDTDSKFTQVAGPNAAAPVAGTKYVFSTVCPAPTPPPSPTPTPTVPPAPPNCPSGATAAYLLLKGQGSITPGTQDIGNNCDDCVTPITFPFPVTFYGEMFSSANVSSNGNLQFTGTNNEFRNDIVPNDIIPKAIFAFWDDLTTDTPGDGIFTATTGQAPNRVFHIEWRARHFETGALANFELVFFEGSADFDVVYGFSTGAFSASFGVQQAGISDLFTIAGGVEFYPRPAFGDEPPAAGTRFIYSAACPLAQPISCGTGPLSRYEVTESTGTITPGTEDTGVECGGGCAAFIALPFPVTIFERTFTSAYLSNNGNVQFRDEDSDSRNDVRTVFDGTAIQAFYDAMQTNFNPLGNPGVFTSVTGNAPNRVFNIEWRAGGVNKGANFEIQLIEGSTSFNLLYGESSGTWTASIGVHAEDGARYTRFAGPNATPPPAGTKLTFDLFCPASTPTPTPTATPVPTAPPSPTPPPLPQPPADDECYLDQSFDSDGRLVPGPFSGYDAIYEVAQQSDGKLIVAGVSDTRLTLARYLPDGALDPSFGAGGVVTTSQTWARTDAIEDTNEGVRVVLALQGDGKIILAGTVGSGFALDFGLLRFNADGSPDTSFGMNGLVRTDVSGEFFSEDILNDIAIQPDGKILALGSGLVRYHPDGTLDEDFGNEGKAVHGGIALAALPDGNILIVSSVGYQIEEVGFESGWQLYRINSVGKLDITFGNEGRTNTLFDPDHRSVARDFLIQPNGKIVVAGYAFLPTGSFEEEKYCAIARYTANGQPDLSFDGDGRLTTDAGAGSDEINRIALQPDGKIVAVGANNLHTGTEDFIALRYESNGALDGSFGTGGIASTDFFGRRDWGSGVAVQADGKIVAVGLVTAVGTGRDFGLARYLPDGQLDSTFDGDGKVTTARPSTATIAYAEVVAQPDGKVLTGGVVGEVFLVARLNADGSPDASFGANGVVTTAFDNYLGDIGQDGELPRPALFTIARLPDGRIVAGGGSGFGNDFGTDRYFLFARYNADGSPDTTFGGGDGYSGFGFYKSGNTVSSDEGATEVLVLPDGSIIASGQVRNDPPSGGFTTAYIRRFNPDGTRNTGFFQNLASRDVTSLAALPDGRIAVGASSAVAGEISNFFLALISGETGALDTSFNGTGMTTTDFGAIDGLSDLVVQPDSKVVAVGQSIGAAAGSNHDLALARYNPDGSLDSLFSEDGKVLTNLGAFEFANTVLLLPDNKLLVGGSTRGTSTATSNSLLARYNSDGSLDLPFGDRGWLVSVVCAGDAVIQNVINGLAAQADGRVVAAGRPGLASYLDTASSNCVASCPTGSTSSQLLNIATRLRVQSGENVLIGGFIITGTDPKKVMIRGIGPSLEQFFSGALPDPRLELFEGSTLLASNDNWRENEAEITATGIPPTNDLESALVQTLPPGSYTAVLSATGDATGIGVVEAYDLDQAANSKLANIATRGFVDSGDNVMIGGFIVGGGSAGARVLVRGIGPSLASFVTGVLENPTLELRNGDGSLIRANDDWRESQEAEIQATTIPPTNDLESAIVASVGNGNYTAILRGKDDTTGIAVVEVYNLE